MSIFAGERQLQKGDDSLHSSFSRSAGVTNTKNAAAEMMGAKWFATKTSDTGKPRLCRVRGVVNFNCLRQVER